jgi:hypothetical protein
MELGLGLCGYNPNSFWAMDMSELMAAVDGKMELLEMQNRTHWETARMLGVTILQPHAKKGRRIKPTDVARFPWDNETPADIDELKRNFRKYNGEG